VLAHQVPQPTHREWVAALMGLQSYTQVGPLVKSRALGRSTRQAPHIRQSIGGTHYTGSKNLPDTGDSIMYA
jgi:hypothetical protein